MHVTALVPNKRGPKLFVIGAYLSRQIWFYPILQIAMSDTENTHLAENVNLIIYLQNKGASASQLLCAFHIMWAAKRPTFCFYSRPPTQWRPPTLDIWNSRLLCRCSRSLKQNSFESHWRKKCADQRENLIKGHLNSLTCEPSHLKFPSSSVRLGNSSFLQCPQNNTFYIT